MKTLYLTYSSRAEGGQVMEGQENDAWPCYEDEDIEFDLHGCYLDKPNEWSREEHGVDFPVRKGDTVYIVVVRYGTGCTFGCSNGNWKITDIVDTRQEAKKIEETIYDGTHEKSYVWTGYFDNLENVEIHERIVR